MPARWNAEADRKLFLSILFDQNVKVNTESTAAALTEGGFSCTPRAVEERLKKLKKMAQKGTCSGDGDNDGTPARKSKTTPRRKKSAQSEEDSDSENPSPTKKPRGGKKEDATNSLSPARDEDQHPVGEEVNDWT